MSRTDLVRGAALLVRGAAAAALACVVPSVAAASSLRADGVAVAGAHTDNGVPVKTLTPGPGSLEIVVGSSADYSLTDNLPPFQTWDMAAVDSGIGSARYGALAGSAFAEASSLPPNLSLLAGGTAQVIPGYTDGARVLSDTLADGTPVTVAFRMTLDATASHVLDVAGLDPDGTGAAARHEVALSDLDNPAQLPSTGALFINSRGESQTSRVLEIDTAIGHDLELKADLYVAAGVQVHFEVHGFSDGMAEVRAGQTGELFYEPSGDVRLETESGHDYAAPEPGQVWLTLAATLALWGRRVRLRFARGRVVRGAAAVALVCLAPALAAAGALRATAVHNALVYNTADAGESSLTPGPGSLTITAGTAASEGFVNPQPPPDAWQGEALGDASGTARYGSLAGRAHAEASSLPANNDVLARVLVSVKPGYTDGAEVLSDTLAPGTPVTLSFRMALDATAVHFVDPSNGVGPTGAGAEYKVVLRDVDDLTLPEAQRILAVASSGVQQTSATLELSTAIGHRIELVADLIVGARVDVDYGTYEVAQGSADVLAEQTAGLFYEPSGDVRLVTDSGHDYAVPEPGRVWLTLAAALVLSGRRRRGRHPRRRVARGAAAVALACLAPSAVAASSLRALGVASAGAHRVSGLEERLLTPGPGSLQITLAAAAGDAVFAEPPPTNFEISAMVDGIGVARYGSLAGRAHAEAHSAPAGPYLAGGQVSVSPGFTDGAEVRSDTLAPDTPVTLTFRMTLAATAMHSVNPGSLDSQGTGAAARYDVALSDLDNPLQLPAAGSLVINSRGFEETSRVLELDTAIGHQVELVADLSVNANVRVDYPFLGVSDGTADVFAEQTGELFYDPSGDVRLETESGHDYAAPEPRRAILLVLAAAALLLRRGRHPRGAEALAG